MCGKAIHMMSDIIDGYLSEVQIDIDYSIFDILFSETMEFLVFIGFHLEFVFRVDIRIRSPCLD